MEKEMVQQIMRAPHQVGFRKVPVPAVLPGQVKVRIQMIGICGSDIHVFHGTHPFTSYPVTQGHEVSGEIVEVGENVTNLTIGQRVTIEPQVVCGKCYPCRHGKYTLSLHDALPISSIILSSMQQKQRHCPRVWTIKLELCWNRWLSRFMLFAERAM